MSTLFTLHPGSSPDNVYRSFFSTMSQTKSNWFMSLTCSRGIMESKNEDAMSSLSSPKKRSTGSGVNRRRPNNPAWWTSSKEHRTRHEGEEEEITRGQHLCARRAAHKRNNATATHAQIGEKHRTCAHPSRRRESSTPRLTARLSARATTTKRPPPWVCAYRYKTMRVTAYRLKGWCVEAGPTGSRIREK